MKIKISKNQREAAVMSGIEDRAVITGCSACYELEWHPNHTGSMISMIKAKTPEHGNRSIPYKSLIVKIITAHRGEE